MNPQEFTNMQTFLPYRDFVLTAQCLDRLRLGKQRVEAYQILQVRSGKKGWSNHPAVKMWRGHELYLALYGIEICKEWIRRGYKDSMLVRFEGMINENMEQWKFQLEPKWFGLNEFHRSHRSNLVRKLPEHYRQYFSDVPNDLPYVWPI